MIADYDGTVLIVSHDRDFLDKTVTVTLGLDGSGKVDVVAGGYADWEKRRTVRAPAKTGAPSTKTAPASPELRPSPEHKSKTKLSYKDQRDYDLLPARVEELAATIARDEAALSDGDLYTRDPKRFDALTAAIAKAQNEKDAAEERWLMLAEQVEG